MIQGGPCSTPGLDRYDHCCDQVLEELRLSGVARFGIKGSPYYPNCSERCVEIPWAISNFRGEERILDVGVSADQVYLSEPFQPRKLRPIIILLTGAS